MSGRTVVVSIGRNVSRDTGDPEGIITEPMPDGDWEDFMFDLNTELPYPVVFSGRGVGTDSTADTLTAEESYTLILADVSDEIIATLPARLAALARAYGQECVALTVGETTFPGSTPEYGEGLPGDDKLLRKYGA